MASGFAGSPTHDAVPSISDGRGYPDDFKVVGEDHIYAYDERKEWMGDHSHTWVTAREIQEYPHWDTPIEFCGVIEREQFDQWDRKTCPKSYSGGVMGGRVVHADYKANLFPEGWTHVTVYWHQTMRERCAIFWLWFEYIKAKHAWKDDGLDSIRFVIGFDS